MARHADPTGVPKKRRGPQPRYPWTAWVDGEWWELRHGDDYTVATASFRSTAHTYAVRKGLRFESQATDDGIFIRFTQREAGA